MQPGARPVHTESKLQSLWAADGEATTKNVGTCIGPAEPIPCADAQCTNSLILYLEKRKHNEQPGHRGRNLIERFMAGNTALPLSQRIECRSLYHAHQAPLW